MWPGGQPQGRQPTALQHSALLTVRSGTAAGPGRGRGQSTARLRGRSRLPPGEDRNPSLTVNSCSSAGRMCPLILHGHPPPSPPPPRCLGQHQVAALATSPCPGSTGEKGARHRQCLAESPQSLRESLEATGGQGLPKVTSSSSQPAGRGLFSLGPCVCSWT